MKKTVKFTKDFANRKKGDTFVCDGLLASQLVRKDKVAEYVKEGKAEKPAAPSKPKGKAKPAAEENSENEDLS